MELVVDHDVVDAKIGELEKGEMVSVERLIVHTARMTRRSQVDEMCAWIKTACVPSWVLANEVTNGSSNRRATDSASERGERSLVPER